MVSLNAGRKGITKELNMFAATLTELDSKKELLASIKASPEWDSFGTTEDLMVLSSMSYDQMKLVGSLLKIAKSKNSASPKDTGMELEEYYGEHTFIPAPSRKH